MKKQTRGKKRVKKGVNKRQVRKRGRELEEKKKITKKENK